MVIIAISAALSSAGLIKTQCHAITANKVFYEFWPAKGIFRVRFFYTIPELKEAREGKADFTSAKKANEFYYAILRGADFYLNSKGEYEFLNPRLAPEPW